MTIIRSLHRRQSLVAALVAAPTVLVAIGVMAVETWRVHAPKSSLFTTPFVYSLADAVESGDMQRAFAFLRGGQDPNRPIPVADAVLTGGQTVLASPVLWATAVQNERAVLMLLGFDARLETPADRSASCLADALGNERIAGVLREYGKALPKEQCPVASLGLEPLLALVGQTHVSLSPAPR